MKLTPIPNNTVVHTPTEAEAKELLAILHENGYKWYCSDKEEGWENFGDETCYRINSKANVYHTCDREWYETICLHCILPVLTLAEFKERYVLNEDNFAKSEEEQPQPKFKVGDKVRLVGYDTIYTVEEVRATYKIRNSDGLTYSLAKDCDLTPAQTPKQKPTEENPFKAGDEVMFADDCSDNDIHIVEEIEGMNIIIDSGKVYPYEMFVLFERKIQKPTENMETKELNLCELLEGHEGETFYSPVCGTDIELKKVYKSFLVFYLDKDDDCTIECETRGWQRIGTLDDCGTFKSITYPDSACLIFPSRELYEQYPLDPYTAWMKWLEEQKKHWLSVTAWIDDIECESDTAIDTNKIYFRSFADRDKCIEEIKAIINKYQK